MRFTQANWNKLAAKIVHAMLNDKSSEAILTILESWFPKAQKLSPQARTTPRKISNILLRKIASKRSSVEDDTNPSDDEPGVQAGGEEVLSQRSVWRYFDDTSLATLHAESLTVFWTFFQMARLRFGLF